MASSNNPRFRLLVGWCCLMTSGLLIMTVYTLLKKTDANTTELEKSPSENNTRYDQQTGSWYGPSFNDYIRLIRDNKKTWICNSCERRPFTLNNDTVELETSGLYHIHAQVTFDKVNGTMKKAAEVTLLKPKGHKTQLRILSRAITFEPATLTVIRLVQLAKGESLRLDIKPEYLRLSKEECDTYWEIWLYKSQVSDSSKGT